MGSELYFYGLKKYSPDRRLKRRVKEGCTAKKLATTCQQGAARCQQIAQQVSEPGAVGGGLGGGYVLL